MSNHFNKVGALRPRRTLFDLSYRKNFTCDMGQLIPVMCDEMVPGDTFKIGNELVVRFQPLATPVMHEVSASVHYFFVPYRILWEGWEDFISQGFYNDDGSLPIQLPAYAPVSSNMRKGTLWDYFGFPVSDNISIPVPPPTLSSTIRVMDMPWRAYNTVYNEYYRDQNLQQEVPILQNNVLNRNWRKDYFTSALPFRQKGTAPALPVDVNLLFPGLMTDAELANSMRVFFPNITGTTTAIKNSLNAHPATATTTVDMILSIASNESINRPMLSGATANSGTPLPGFNAADLKSVNGLSRLQDSIVNARAQSTTFNVSDLRLAFQTQKWLERNARAGTRYTEFLRSHFGVSPSDARLDRPEYVGGSKVPIIISEVLQTSQTTSDSPQAQFAGHGLSADSQYIGSYHAQEYGLMIALMSVMPKPSYQDGINRQWLRRLPTDFYFPEFAHLSEQSIYRAEIAYDFNRLVESGNGTLVPLDNYEPFGFTGQYDEMRIKHDIVCSDMRITFDGNAPEQINHNLSYWNLTRKFYVRSDVPMSPGGIERRPYLNSEFITCNPRKDIFAVTDVPGLIVNCSNLIHAIRPLPPIAEPGLVDHF